MRRLFVALLLICVPWVAYAQYYVCTSNCVNGASPSDASSNCSTGGTFAAPFLTLAHAQTVMRACSTKTTYIEGGTYTLTANFAFTSSDANEKWLAYPGANVTISGNNAFGVSLANGSNNITIEGITFTNLVTVVTGGDISLSNSVSGFTFRWNTMVACTAFCIEGESTQNALIDSNTFSGQSPGQPSPGNDNAAILLEFGSSGNTISHNLFQNINGNGVVFAAAPTDPPCSNNTVDSNVLINVDANLNQGGDGGALYMIDRSHSATGNKITNNVGNGIGNGSHTDASKFIYLDDDISNVTVTGNLCFNDCGQFAIQYHGGDHNTVNNNVFVIAPGGQLGLYQNFTTNGDFGMAGNTFQNNVVYYTSTVTTPLWNDIHGADAFPTVSGNMWINQAGNTIPNSQTGYIDTSPIFCGPSQGINDVGNTLATQLWSSFATGVVSGWAAIATNQGPLQRSCTSF